MENRTKALDIVKIGAAVSALSVLIVFAASLASVMYTRGVLAELGFPAALLDIKTAAALFSVIGYQRSLILVGIGILGFVPTKWVAFSETKRQAAFYIILIVSAITLALAISGSQSAFIRRPTGMLTLALPLFIGFTFRTNRNTLEQYSRTLVVAALVVAMFSVDMRQIGAGHALRVKETKLGTEPLHKGLTSAAEDFAIISLVSTEDLPFLRSTSGIEHYYEFEPCNEDFLRFIAEDESKYLLIEQKGENTIPFAVRKEIVSGIVFKPGSGVPRPEY